MRKLVFVLSLVPFLSGVLPAAVRATLTGTVVNRAGHGIGHAIVMVWHAGVKQGYSTYCPSCYVDCGKRTVTAADGSYTIKGLDPDLKFQLLIVRDGYTPVFVDKVDPASGPAPAATLEPRPAIADPARVVRGRVVNPFGRSVVDAVVEPQGVMYDSPDGMVSVYGTVKGLEPIAITNGKGEFELAFDKAAAGMLVQVEARGMAPGIFNTLSTGLDRKTITVTQGATVRGRVVRNGKPLGGTEVGLIAREHGWGARLKIIGFPYSEIRVGTQPGGSFAITNVPPGVDWYVYARMGSIPGDGAAPIVECATKRDNEEVDVGVLEVKPGLHLRGQVVLNDGNPVPNGMRVTVGSTRAFDSQTALLPPDGRFAFSGLRSDDYEVFASVKGYRLVGGKQGQMPVKVGSDVNDFVLTLAPGQ